MRLWSIHPKYLDAKGLVALWMESLLAQKVLMSKTKGYKIHPQLDRFKKHPHPVSAIGCYLYQVHKEGARRGYNFTIEKILSLNKEITAIKVHRGQILFEFEHLMKKLTTRAPERYQKLLKIKQIEPHPIFKIVAGDIEPWEKSN